VSGCDVEGNLLYDLAPSGVGQAVQLTAASGNRVRGNQATFGWGVGVLLDALSNVNIVGHNEMSAAAVPYSDLGAGNDLAHNF
jgi:hypothetical protein